MTTELTDALARVTFETMALLTKVAAEHDLSLTQLRVLAILRDRRVRMTELAAYLGLDKSTMTGLVDRAQKRGLIERAPSEQDRRAVDVYLGPAGIALKVELEQASDEALRTLTGRLAPPDQRRLQNLLERMV